MKNLKEIPEHYVQTQSRIQRPKFAALRSVDFDEMPDYEGRSKSATGKDYQKGMRVRHPTFGVGSIYQVEGNGEMQKVSVVFHDQTFKKFVVKYARLEVL